MQRPDELFLCQCQRGLCAYKTRPVQLLERHVVLLQHFDILGNPVKLSLDTKQLQRALRALVITNARFRPQCLEAIAAALRNGHHAALVQVVGALVAVGQHGQAKTPQRRIEQGLNDQRAVRHQQHLIALIALIANPARPKARNNRAKPHRRCRSWFPRRGQVGARSPPPHAQPVPGSRRSTFQQHRYQEPSLSWCVPRCATTKPMRHELRA
jgi:hypothetical protein